MSWWGWGYLDPEVIRAQYQAQEVPTSAPVDPSALPPPTTSGTIVISVGGVYESGTIEGTANEISVAQVGNTITISFDAAYFLKGYNTASAIRTRIGLGGLAVLSAAAASADAAGAPGAAYVQAESAAILAELRDLKSKLRSAGILAT